jgi:hypothetical protein
MYLDPEQINTQREKEKPLSSTHLPHPKKLKNAVQTFGEAHQISCLQNF